MCFVSEKATFISVFLKSLVILLTSLPQHVEAAHFVLWYWGQCVYLVFMWEVFDWVCVIFVIL
jgi:hypothetical protein